MYLPTTSPATLKTVTDIMRDLSKLTDPDDAAELYGSGITQFNLVPRDRYIALSRRELSAPQYRITRNTAWTEHPNPWTQREKLPLLSGGLLAEILYSNQPAIITDLKSRLATSDPAHPYLHDMDLLIALPHFDNGESINYGIILAKNGSAADNYPLDTVPMMVWMANLWGRATLNLVNKQKLDAAYQSLDRELQIVGDIQRSLLPRALPTLEHIDIAAHYKTSQRAGGDYYDFFPLPENKYGIFVADVSGHGTPAAVVMAITHAIAHSRPGHPMPPVEVLAYLNKQLAHHYTRDTGTFITALYGVLDPAGRTFTFASAGHPLPRLLRNSVARECTVETSLPLGILEQETFHEYALHLHHGDKLLLYTDGITESFDPAGEQFATTRLDSALAKSSPSAEACIQNILAALDIFTHNAPLTDDRTLLALLFH